MSSSQLNGGDARPIRYLRTLDQLPQIPADQREALDAVARWFPFRANEYYLGLIDWSDPADPIRRLVIPDEAELFEADRLDPCNEADHTVAPGVQHKYRSTVLLLCSHVCGGLCRYCFRKRLFMGESNEVAADVSEGIEYIRHHPEVTNVLLTGGDPLMLSTFRLRSIIDRLWGIPHVRIIRIGSKMPAFNPHRILDDPELTGMFRQYTQPNRRLYLMTHFDHPRELTDAAGQAIRRCTDSGVVCFNQCPILRGINDDPAVLARLLRRLSFTGSPQYYMFQCRPTAGNEPYSVPIVEAYGIFQRAMARVSGVAKHARYVMSHETGKIEILAVDERHIYMRYHRAFRQADSGRFLVFYRDDEARWFDDLVAVDELGGDVMVDGEASLAAR